MEVYSVTYFAVPDDAKLWKNILLSFGKQPPKTGFPIWITNHYILVTGEVRKKTYQNIWLSAINYFLRLGIQHPNIVQYNFAYHAEK